MNFEIDGKERNFMDSLRVRWPQEIDNDLSCQWLMQIDLKVQTEATICAAQELALRTYHIKNKIDKTSENPLCRMCREKGELCSIYNVNVKN